MMEFDARIIKKGRASGEVLFSNEPISFFGTIDPKTGVVLEENHCLYNESLKDRILVFPTGKGSTVGSYSLYRMMKNNVAPAGIINEECEPIVAVGAIISDIPCVDHVDITSFSTGDWVRIDGSKVIKR